MSKEKKKRNSLKKIIVVLVLFGPGIVILLLGFNKCENHFETLPNFGQIPQYEFIDVNGNIINNETQKGRITIFNTLQTTCPKTCAIDLFKFNLILYQDLRKNQDILSDVDIISIITDENGNPVNDASEVAYTLNDIMELYDPTIWNLVVGDPKQIYNIEMNEINLYEVESESSLAGKGFLETMLLIDKENDLRLIRRGSIEGYIRDFKQNVSLLNQEYYELEKAEKQKK